MRIRILHHVEAGKCRDQHEQSRARQVEIGHHHVDGAKAIAGGDEQRGLSREWIKDSILGARAFEQPQRGGADRDDTAPGAAYPVERLCRFRAHAAVLGIKVVVRCVSGLYRKERARPHAQRQLVQGDAALLQASEQTHSVKCKPAVGAATDPS